MHHHWNNRVGGPDSLISHHYNRAESSHANGIDRDDQAGRFDRSDRFARGRRFDRRHHNFIRYTPEQRQQAMAVNKDFRQKREDLFRQDNITLR